MKDTVLRFMGSDRGRVARVAVGSSLLTWGLTRLDTTAGKAAAVVALAPLLSGITDRCVLPTPSS